jgi:hypothetical protein
MAATDNTPEFDGEPGIYEIRLRGHLDPQWADWFGGLTVTPQANGDTLLTGPVADQAALYGLLRRMRDVGLPLLSVIRTGSGRPDAPHSNA